MSINMSMEVHPKHKDATLGEASSFLRCSVKTVTRRIRAGEIASFRYTDHGPIFITWDELHAYRRKAIQRKEHANGSAEL